MILYLTRVKRLYSSIYLSRTPPLNLKQVDEAIFDKQALTYTVPDSYLVYIKNALVTDLGIIIKGLRPLKEFINCYEIDFKYYAFKYSIKAIFSFRRMKTNAKEKHLLIFDNYSGPRGFFHWIADGLTRLVELKDIIKEYTVIVPEYFKEESLYTDTLSFFDIKKAIYLPNNSIIKVK